MNFITYNNFTGSRVRGTEIAEYLGASINGERTGTVIHVKPPDLSDVKDGEWVDMSDGGFLVDPLRERPKINVIMLTKYAYDSFEMPNKTVLIPQQHVNWDNERREEREIKVCGYIGPPSDHARRYYGKLFELIKGWEFVTCFNSQSRQDAINFYKSIDLLVVGSMHRYEPFKSPTKLINAASFGIPSIAYQVPGYREFEGFYIPMDVHNLDKQANAFKDPIYYKEWSDKIIAKAEEYHVSKIAELYKQL